MTEFIRDQDPNALSQRTEREVIALSSTLSAFINETRTRHLELLSRPLAVAAGAAVAEIVPAPMALDVLVPVAEEEEKFAGVLFEWGDGKMHRLPKNYSFPKYVISRYFETQHHALYLSIVLQGIA